MVNIPAFSSKPDKSYLLRLTCKKRIWTAYKKSYEKTLTAIENESLTSKSIDSLVINLNTGSFLQTCSDNSTQNNTYYLFIKKSGVFIFQYLAAPYDFNYLKLDDYRKISKTVELVKFLQSELSSLPVR